MKKIIFAFVFFVLQKTIYAQGNLSGTLLDYQTQKPLFNAILNIENTSLTVFSNQDGFFEIKNIPAGKQILAVKSKGYEDKFFEVFIENQQPLHLGTLYITQNTVQYEDLTAISLDEAALEDDAGVIQNNSGLLQASNDALQQAMAFQWSGSRFAARGLSNDYTIQLINAVAMTRFSDGRPVYANWGGLNDLLKNQDFTMGTTPNDYIFSGTGGAQNLLVRASNFRATNKIVFSKTNTNNNNSIRFLKSFGTNKKGWSYVVSGSRRWAQEAYFEGTTFDATALFMSVEKEINTKQSLNFSAFFTSVKRGKSAPNTDEVNRLKSKIYNPYWGFQAGEKRNSRIKDIQEPFFLLNHYWKIKDNIKLNTNVFYQFGKIGDSRIDYQNVDSPDPVYYKKLPSYYTTLFTDATPTPDNATAEIAKNQFLANGQLDWANMYRINRENLASGSRFAQYEDRKDEKTISGSSILAAQLAQTVFLNAGVSFANADAHYFKNMLDLLGGNFYNDVSLFGITAQQQQSDLNNPDRKIAVGYSFGYDYKIASSRLEAFTQFKFSYPKINFYLAQKISQTQYQRTGLYKNGYYPDTSFGKSNSKSFDDFGFKTGFTYRFSGYYFFDFNAVYMTKAPVSNLVFPNQRLNNNTFDGVLSETIGGLDFSYLIRKPNFKARFTAYYNQVKNATTISYFYADGLALGSEYVLQILTQINKQNKGLELSVNYQLNASLKANLAVAYGDYRFVNNPNLFLTNDTKATTTAYGEANIKDYKTAGTPQKAYAFGLEYENAKHWRFGATINYLADTYIDFAPILRTQNFITQSDELLFPYDEKLAKAYLQQEKLPSYVLTNIVFSKSWRIKNNFLNLFASLNNVFNTTYKVGGFEQARNATYSELYKDHQGPERAFGNKYFWGFGRTFNASLSYNFD